MKNLINFLCRAFPAKKRTVLLGLSYGVLIVAICWYPLPLLIENVVPPKWMIYMLILAFVCIVFWLFLSGKLLADNWGMVGWTGIGYLASGIFLTILSFSGFKTYSNPMVILVSGLFLLAVYIIVFKVRHTQRLRE